METALVAKAFDGNALYQQRARAALPILVRQAHAGVKIVYGDLAAELGMSNPRTLNYPLGCIGTALGLLSKEWNEDIPMINCLAVNRTTDLPGQGVGWFVRDKGEFKKLPRRQQHAIVDAALADVFAYPRWNRVLDAFGLKPAVTGYKAVIDSAARYRGKGESELHKALKKYVSKHPGVVGLAARSGPGKEEFDLPSGDSVDVLFSYAGVQTAVEVKSRISEYADIVRGLFQCVKYRAVLKAWIGAENGDDSADAVLVLEGDFPDDLRPLRSILDVRVVDNVRVP